MSSDRSKRRLLSCLAVAATIVFAECCHAQSVFNIPPGIAPGPQQLVPGTIIRLGEGGRLGTPYNANTGTLGAYAIPAGVLLESSGGWLDVHLALNAGARAELSGGTVAGSLEAQLGSELVLRGTDFQVDGVSVAALVELGDEALINLADGQLLTGRLADGTPFAFSSHDWQPSASRGVPSLPWTGGDKFALGSLRLVETDTPIATPGTIVHSANSEYAQRWISDGQVLELESLGRTPVGFTAGPGSKVIVNTYSPSPTGPTIYGVANEFEAIGAEVELVSGAIGAGADLFAGTHMTMTGGRVNPYMQIHNGSTLDLQGGEVAFGLTLMPGGNVNVQGGILGTTSSSYPYSWNPSDRVTTAYAGSSISLQAGTIPTRVTLFPGARMEQSGGLMSGVAEIHAGATYRYAGGAAHQLNPLPGATLEVVGGEFTINGILVEELGTNPGDTLEVVAPSGGFLSGILSDGRGFVLSATDGTNLSTAKLRLVRAELESAELGTIVVPPDAAPLTARAGQIIRVEHQGALPAQFVAGVGSRVEVAGGSVGASSRYVGAELLVNGGTIDVQAKIYAGTTARLENGTIRNGFTAHDGTSLEVSGGVLDSSFLARSGADIDIRGGRVMSDFVAETGSSVRLVGSEFRVDGVPIGELANIGDTTQLNLANGKLLTGVLSDGTGIAFHFEDGDRIADGTLTLELSAPATTGPSEILLPASPAPPSIGRGQRLTVQTDGRVPADFIAGPGSEVVVSGGNVDWDFEAIESSFTMSAGSANTGFRSFDSIITQTGGQFFSVELFKGSTFTMSGGGVTSTVALQQNTEATLTGGTIGGLAIQEDSVATLSGVEVEGTITTWTGGQLELAGGSTERIQLIGGSATLRGGGLGDDFTVVTSANITLHGSDFRLNGQPVTQFNTSHLVELAGETISGVLADGTPFVLVDDVNNEDNINGGKFTFVYQPYTPGPASLNAATSPQLLGIHSGQTLRVASGATLKNNFNAGPGSNVVIQGGTIGTNFEALGANVRLESGIIRSDADVFADATLEMYGGETGSNLDIHPGGKMVVHAGKIGSLDNRGLLVIHGGETQSIDASSGAITELRGGVIKSYYYDNSDAKLVVTGGRMTQSLSISEEVAVSGGTFDSTFSITMGGKGVVSGGTFKGPVQGSSQSVLSIEGGQFENDMSMHSGATLNLIGEYFLLDGVPIAGFSSLDDTQLLAARTGQLEVGFAGGGSHLFNLSATQQSGYDYFHASASIYLTKLASGEVLLGDFNGDGLVNIADYTVWRDHLGASDTQLSPGSTNDGTGIVDAGDYTTWRAHFGTTSGNLAGSDSQAVPEPSTLLLLTAPALLPIWNRRIRA